MGKEKIKIDFEKLAGGAFAERTRQAIEQVMDNIADPNTEWKPKRKVTVDLTFTTDELREIIELDVVAKPKLATKKGIHTKILSDKDLNGEILASEYKKQIPGQQAIKVDTETGEVLEEKKETISKPSKSDLQIVK